MFPELKAAKRNGEEITFADGLQGERNLILIAFEREPQKDLDTWLAVLPCEECGNRCCPWAV